MGFKESANFLKFVTMGGLGSQVAKQILEETKGHEIVELERYSTANKIWQTKIKRLRLPDLMCIKCGTRFEVRVKSKLEIKMSHSPKNPKRRWDYGLRDEDIVVLLSNTGEGDTLQIAHELNCFTVKSLRESFNFAKMGAPKSASEGSEIDVTWPSWTPKFDGQVTEVGEKVKLRYDNGKSYTYPLKGKTCYVQVGERFCASEKIIAGQPQETTNAYCPGSVWQPSLDNLSDFELDIYAALKWVSHKGEQTTLDSVKNFVNHPDVRIKIEALGTLAKLGDLSAIESLMKYAISKDSEDAFAMESVFILSEVGSIEAVDALSEIFDKSPYSEVRSAAIWNQTTVNGFIDKSLKKLSLSQSQEAQHLVIGLSKAIEGSESTQRLLAELVHENKVGTTAEVLYRSENPCFETIIDYCLNSENTSVKKIVLVILSRRNPVEVTVAPNFSCLPSQDREFLEAVWAHNEANWATDSEISEKLNFLSLQDL